MNIKRIIRILTFRYRRCDEELARSKVNHAKTEETISLLKEALLRTKASQERAEKLLGLK